MRMVEFERGDGTRVFINPLQVRAVVTTEREMSHIQFNIDHVIMVKGNAAEIARLLEEKG